MAVRNPAPPTDWRPRPAPAVGTDVVPLDPEDRRARKKARTREALEAAAWRLFLRKGFEATTVEDITDAADVSPRTFFRYFPSKEAVLFAEKDRQLGRLAEALAERPASEPALDALEATVVAFAGGVQADRDRHLLRARLALQAPAVAQYSRTVIQAQYEEVLVGVLARRLGVDATTDLRPRVLAGAAVVVAGTATRRWIEGDGAESLPELVAAGFAVLRAAACPPDAPVSEGRTRRARPA